MSTNTIKLKCLKYSCFQICSVDDVKVIDRKVKLICQFEQNNKTTQ